ncbi:MAG: pilus assembly protein PilP, partial [Pseudomonas paracarnis]
YEPSSLRDPFTPPALQAPHVPGRPALAPDFTRPRGLLEGMRLDQFEMVGTLSRGAQAFALLRAGARVYRLAVGDYLGPDHGQVTAIQDAAVELVELFPDGQGAWLERPRTLVLNVNS